MTMHRLSQGGADRVAVLLANGFVAAGIPAAIVVLRSDGEAERALRDLLHSLVGLSSAGAPRPTRHLDLIRGFSYIRRQIEVARPSLVLASSNNMGLVTGLVALAQRPPGPRYAMKVTNPVIRPRDRGPLLKLYRRILYGFILSRFECILVLSRGERTSLATLFPERTRRFRVTPNPYVRPEMLQVRQPGARAPISRVVTLARMMPQKRLDLLLRAFARLTHPGSRLTIVGDGPERQSLEALARGLGISDRVEMPGFTADVLPWLRNADLFALSSDYEGLPGAVVEALACNVPVVTTDCFDEAHDLLAGAARCAVVPRGDAEALARAIDASLAQIGQPTDLRGLALPYRIDEAIAAHIAALAPMLA